MKKKRKKGLAVSMVAVTLLSITLPSQAASENAGWKEDATGWWYQNVDGTYQNNGWFKNADATWYYFDHTGYMQTGWVLDNNTWYYLNSVSNGCKGAMKTGWILDGTKWYFMDSSGRMQTGLVNVDGKVYYLNPASNGTKGSVLAGIIVIDGKSYTFDANGAAYGNIPNTSKSYDRNGKISMDTSVVISDPPSSSSNSSKETAKTVNLQANSKGTPGNREIRDLLPGRIYKVLVGAEGAEIKYVSSNGTLVDDFYSSAPLGNGITKITGLLNEEIYNVIEAENLVFSDSDYQIWQSKDGVNVPTSINEGITFQNHTLIINMGGDGVDGSMGAFTSFRLSITTPETANILGEIGTTTYRGTLILDNNIRKTVHGLKYSRIEVITAEDDSMHFSTSMVAYTDIGNKKAGDVIHTDVDFGINDASINYLNSEVDNSKLYYPELDTVSESISLHIKTVPEESIYIFDCEDGTLRFLKIIVQD